MSKHSENKWDDILGMFSQAPDSNQKAWSLISDFYNLILNHMDKRKITKAELATRLGRSRAAISHMFNKTPNISVRKMVEIADAIGIDLALVENTDRLRLSKSAEKPDEIHITVIIDRAELTASDSTSKHSKKQQAETSFRYPESIYNYSDSSNLEDLLYNSCLN